MGKKSRPTFRKRQKELARRERQRNKQEQRKAKSERKAERAPGAGGDDPDLEGIRPGPQPLPDEWQTFPEEDDLDGDSGEGR